MGAEYDGSCLRRAAARRLVPQIIIIIIMQQSAAVGIFNEFLLGKMKRANSADRVRLN